MSGIEPPTSSLRTKRSSQLSYTPMGECRCYRALGLIVVPGTENPFSGYRSSSMVKAQTWADHLAATSQLQYSDMRADMPEGGYATGENIGQGLSVDSVDGAFIQPPKHRANLPDPRWSWAGVRIARPSNGAVLVVQLFCCY